MMTVVYELVHLLFMSTKTVQYQELSMKSPIVKLFLFFTIGFLALTTSGAEINRGLILYLPFEEAGNPVDHSESPAKPKKNGKLEHVKGKFGKALRFNGKGDNVVEVPSVAKLSGMKKLTIAAWVKPNGIKGSDGMSIISKRFAHKDGDCYNLFIWTGQKVYARVNSTGQISSNTTLEDGNWYHIAYTFEGGGKAKLFINGKAEAETNHPEKEVLKDDKSPVWVGELNEGRNFAWNGIMDDVAMWNRTLDEKEIKSVMNSGLQLLLSVDQIDKLATTWAELK